MSQKLALVVDDSESARQVLRRMLEKHNIAVDTTSSASEALDYLARHRPDVIFMDHNMPGMDGLEAVKHIKANPKTVTIPVMMYTSKEGDLYLGEARALGAVGILPKTVAPGELFGALVRLGLTQDRRTNPPDHNPDGPSERATDIAEMGTRGWAHVDEPIPVLTHANPPSEEDNRLRFLLEEQRVELRKDILVSIESVSRNVNSKLTQELDKRFQNPQPVEKKSSGAFWKLATIGSFFLLAWALSGIHTLKNQITDLTASLTPKISRSIARAKAPNQRAKPAQQVSIEKKPVAKKPPGILTTEKLSIDKSMPYPYQELALDKERLEMLDSLVNKLKERNFEGRVTLETHVGDFCLTGNTAKGFELADPDLPLTQCDFIGNPVQPTDLPATQQSLQFANLLSSLDLDGKFDIEIVSLPRANPLSAYPERNQETKAGEWNKAATANNMVLIDLQSE
ncbi:MAG: response regulator [Gammaproteobacteria bacterium]